MLIVAMAGYESNTFFDANLIQLLLCCITHNSWVYDRDNSY